MRWNRERVVVAMGCAFAGTVACTPLTGDVSRSEPLHGLATVHVLLHSQAESITREIALTAFYQRRGSSTARVLASQTVNLVPGLVTVPFSVPLSECLSDALRDIADESCPLRIAVALRDAAGELLDSTATSVVAARPGETITAPALTFVVPAGIDVAGPDSVVIGSTVAFQATVRDSAGAALLQRAVTWSSSAPAIATVADDGTVTALALGSATITARSLTATTSRQLVVAPRPFLVVTDTAFQLVQAVGDDNLAPLSISVSNGGGGTLGTIRIDTILFETGGASGWIADASLNQNTSPATLTIQPGVSELGSGSYRARIRLAAATPGVAPRSITVSLNLSFKATALVSGLIHSCGRVPAGSWYCWGGNGDGQLGIGTMEPFSSTPRRVTTPPGVEFESMHAGRAHTCALTPLGEAYCWGANTGAQLGLGAASDRVRVPTFASALVPLRFAQLDGGAAHTCGLSSTGAPWCWGSALWGELGNGTFTPDLMLQPAAVLMPAGTQVTAIDVGWISGCAMTLTSQLYCWGYNATGELGLGTTQSQSRPTLVTPPPGVTFAQVSRNEQQACATSSASAIFCWGTNTFGQVGGGAGLPQQVLSPVPIQAPPGVSFVAVTAAAESACGRTAAGQLYCWGSNREGELARGTRSANPNPVPALIVTPTALSFVDLVGGAATYCGRTDSGDVYCWGLNVTGQMGIGFAGASIPVPTKIP